ncbi:MAG: hypothetical protein H7831_00830 [Magnetococcus sp. WYHC-3]
MSAAPLDMLDRRDDAAVARYERAFYQAFQRVVGNRLIRSLWLWDDDAGRLATRIGYDQQVIYVQPGATTPLAAAVAVNVAMCSLQAGAFGFSVPEDANNPCEILTFFSVAEHNPAHRLALLDQVFVDLRRRGHGDILATAGQRPMAVYRRYFSALGGEVAASATLDGESRYFLRYRRP